MRHLFLLGFLPPSTTVTCSLFLSLCGRLSTIPLSLWFLVLLSSCAVVGSLLLTVRRHYCSAPPRVSRSLVGGLAVSCFRVCSKSKQHFFSCLDSLQLSVLVR
ncbi:uncharacterized protein DS421_20g689070 [Arachis hypogaea]|nr:uncharacterized protein DS421_20g689070 [Arachis hypogaea]